MRLPSASICPSAGGPAFIRCFTHPFSPPIVKLMPMVPTSPSPFRILLTEMNTTRSNLFSTRVSSAPHSTTSCIGRVTPCPMTSGFHPPNSLMPRTSSPPSMPPTLPPLHPPPLLVPPIVVVAAVKRGGVISPLSSHSLPTSLVTTMSNSFAPASPYQQLLATLPTEPTTSPIVHKPSPRSPRHLGNFHVPYFVLQRVLASLKAGEGSAYAAATDLQLTKIRDVVGPHFNTLSPIDQQDRALQVCLLLDPEVYRPLPRSSPTGTRSSNSPLPRPPYYPSSPMSHSPDPHSPCRPPTPYRPIESPLVTMYPSSALQSPSQRPPTPVLASLLTKFSELPANALYDIMILLRTSPDTAPVTIHPSMWSGASEYHERHYAMPDMDEPLSQETTIEHALSYLLDLKGDCATGLARALHGLDD